MKTLMLLVALFFVGRSCNEVNLLPQCGDSILDPAEVCDDGAANSDTNADACRTNCVPAFCGDGVTDTGENCDSGPLNGQPGQCPLGCLLP